MNKFISIGMLGILTSVMCYATDVKLTSFDKKMIDVEKKMISSNKRFNVNSITIKKKKKIDSRWTMYVFDLLIQDSKSKKKMSTPMIIFSDGVYQTNSLMNLETGERYETIEKIRMQKQMKKSENSEREVFEKSFVLDKKYYNKEHLILGNIDAKNKVIMISDPLCVACVGAFPSIYNSMKDRKDFALFYYHFPLQSLHPTAMLISKAMEYAKEHGVEDIVKKVMFADLSRKYDVYKEKNPEVALKAFNDVLNTSYALKDVENISIKEDMKIGQDVKLRGTPTIIFNGELYKSRQNLAKELAKD